MSQTDSTDPTDNPTTQTPEDVRTTYQDLIEHLEDTDEDSPPFVALLAPRARASLLFAILGATEPLTASELCERADIDRSVFQAHMDVLLAAGIAKNPGKKGNAHVYEPDRSHPVTQLLTMAETVQRHGQTPDLLDDQFRGDPAET